MKRFILKCLLISTMMGLIGCGKEVKEETNQDVVSQDGTVTAESEHSIVATESEHRGIYDQLLIIAENKNMWVMEEDYLYGVYQYAVTDLDHNGRYEVIVSNMGGSGMYTYSSFFEVSENYDALVECTTDFTEFDSQPDIMSGKLETYIDDRGEFHYVGYDLLKNGAAEYYENICELVLRDGKLNVNYLAYKSTIYAGETPTITCTDADGNEITEEAYANTAGDYFAGFQKTTTSLGWQEVSALKGDTAEIAAQLDMSLNIFLYGEQ